MKILFATLCYPTPQLPQYCVFLEQQAVALQGLGHSVDVLHLADVMKERDSDYVFHGVQVYYRNIAKKKMKSELIFPKRLTDKDEENILKILMNGYDVVSFHFGGLDSLWSLEKVCSRCDVPLIHHFHGLNVWGDYFDVHPLLTTYHNILKEYFYKKLSATVNVSNKVKDIFCSRVPQIPSYSVYNGVDTGRFQISDNRKFFKDDHIRILCVANLIQIKGQKYIIEAASELSSMGYDIEVTFAGRGPDEEMLEELAARKSVNAHFVGYLPYDDIAKLMQTSDLFVMPSFYEALGCVYLEAMSAGMITVGVQGQGIDEVIIDGENGFLVEPKSVSSIVETVKKIVELSDDKLKEISKSGRQTSEKYTWEASAKSLEKVYEEVIYQKGKKKYE